MKARKQSSTSYPILFLMVDSTDHVTGKAGLTPTVTISKNGAAFAAPSGAITELSSGWYAIAGNATDRNTLGELLIHATGTGADPLDDRYLVVPFDPFDANALGMAYLTGDSYARLGAPAGASVSADIAAVKAETATIQAKTTNLPAAPASTTNITAATGIDITKILGTAISTPATAGILDVNILNIGGSAADLGATPGMLDVRIAEISVGGQVQFQSTQIAAVSGAVGSVTGAVGSVTGLTASDVGAIKTKTDYLPSATAGAAGGVFIAGANAATSITGALTANITGSMSGNVEGNVNGSVGSVVGNVGGNVTGSVGSVVGFTPSNIADIISTLGNPSEPTMSGDIAAARAALADIKGATFDTATDSLEAIRDRGDAAWDTATGFSTLDAAGVRSAVGLASASLDTQLTAIDDLLDTEVAAIYNRIGAPVGASISADIAGITATVDAADIRAAIGLASANLDTQLGAIDDFLDTEIAAIKAKTDLIPAAPASTTNITAASGVALSAGERTTLANAILDVTDGAVSGTTLREALSVMLSALAGKVSGAGTATITFRHFNDTSDVIVATVDISGNRSAVTVTP